MTTQLERLQCDARELDAYMLKLRAKGNTDLIAKLKSKREFINHHLQVVSSQVNMQ